MLKVCKITLYKMMITGFLSAEVLYHFEPKMKFEELVSKINNSCNEIKPSILNEIQDLLNNEILLTRLYLLEQIEEYVHNDYFKLQTLFKQCIKEIKLKDLETLQLIGEKNFITEYIYCTDRIFASLNFISPSNIKYFTEVRINFSNLFENQLNHNIQNQAESSFMSLPFSSSPENYSDQPTVMEPFGEYTITSGIGFDYKNTFLIDDDAISLNNSKNKKYIIYLYSLDKLEFEQIQKKIESLLSNCSVRLTNSISTLGYRNFLINYFFADEIKLFQIRNFGRKSLFEFNKIREDVLKILIDEYNLKHEETLDEDLKELEQKNLESLSLHDQLGENKYNLLKNDLNKLLINLSRRTQNGIKNYKGDFIEDFIHLKKDIRTIRNIGKKTEEEIKNIISTLSDLIEKYKVQELSEDDIILHNKYVIYEKVIDNFCLEFFKNNHRLPMFRILMNYFNLLFKERDFEIINKIYINNINVTVNLNDIAKDYDLSKTRIEQICQSSIDFLRNPQNSKYELHNLYKLILDNNEDWNYVKNIIYTKDFWSSDEILELMDKESSYIDKSLLILTMSIILSDKYLIIGNEPLVQKQQNTNWRNNYLVRKEIYDTFDFNMFIDYVVNYKYNNNQDLSLSIQEHLLDTFYNAWKQFNVSAIVQLEFIISKLFIEECSIIPDLNLKYTLIGEKELDTADVLYDILKTKGNPITMDELYYNYELAFPGRYSSEQSLRPTVYKDPRLCLVGVNKLVALTEWHHIKMGSIRDLLVDYLSQYNEPKHIKDISSHILKLRNTTERSLSSTMGSGEQFIKFPGGYYGLSDRNYSEWQNLSESDKLAKKYITELENFIVLNNHFPFPSSFNSQEEILYKWLTKIKRQKNVSSLILNEIKIIEEKYINVPKSKQEYIWLKKCEEYKEFKEQKGRMPNRTVLDERDLYFWYSKSLNDFADGKLTELQEHAFSNLCKSL